MQNKAVKDAIEFFQQSSVKKFMAGGALNDITANRRVEQFSKWSGESKSVTQTLLTTDIVAKKYPR